MKTRTIFKQTFVWVGSLSLIFSSISQAQERTATDVRLTQDRYKLKPKQLEQGYLSLDEAQALLPDLNISLDSKNGNLNLSWKSHSSRMPEFKLIALADEPSERVTHSTPSLDTILSSSDETPKSEPGFFKGRLALAISDSDGQLRRTLSSPCLEAGSSACAVVTHHKQIPILSLPALSGKAVEITDIIFAQIQKESPLTMSEFSLTSFGMTALPFAFKPLTAEDLSKHCKTCNEERLNSLRDKICRNSAALCPTFSVLEEVLALTQGAIEKEFLDLEARFKGTSDEEGEWVTALNELMSQMDLSSVNKVKPTLAKLNEMGTVKSNQTLARLAELSEQNPKLADRYNKLLVWTKSKKSEALPLALDQVSEAMARGGINASGEDTRVALGETGNYLASTIANFAKNPAVKNDPALRARLNAAIENFYSIEAPFLASHGELSPWLVAKTQALRNQVARDCFGATPLNDTGFYGRQSSQEKCASSYHELTRLEGLSKQAARAASREAASSSEPLLTQYESTGQQGSNNSMAWDKQRVSPGTRNALRSHAAFDGMRPQLQSLPFLNSNAANPAQGFGQRQEKRPGELPKTVVP